MKKLFSLTLLTALAATLSHAQIKTPQPSPGSELKQTVGLTDISIVYSRPSAKDRAVFGKDGIVMYDQPWRTGANSATKITFSDDLKVGGQEVKKGSYAVITVPGATEWKVSLYTYESSNWSSYLEKTATVSFSAPATKLGHKVETFTIDVNNIRNTSATIDLVWEMTKVSIPVEVEVDKRVTADIDKVLAGPTAGDYYAAASYYHDAGKDLNKALEWIQKATAGDSPAFWQVRREALILGDLGRYDDAVKAAEKSKMLAEKAGNDEYVRMNNKSIEEWKAKKGGKK
jgi:hypothetical protein